MSLTYGTSTILFALKILPFQHGLLLWSPSHKSRYGHSADNVTLLIAGLIWQYLFFPKITMRAFIVVSSSTKFCHGTTIILLSANPTFYQIYYHFRITVKVFLYLINFVWMFTLKVLLFFMLLHNWQGELFPPHGTRLPTSLISERAVLTKCGFKFLLLLKPIIGTSGNTFLLSSS